MMILRMNIICVSTAVMKITHQYNQPNVMGVGNFMVDG